MLVFWQLIFLPLFLQSKEMLQNMHESSLTQTTPLQRSLEKYMGGIECQKKFRYTLWIMQDIKRLLFRMRMRSLFIYTLEQLRKCKFNLKIKVFSDSTWWNTNLLSISLAVRYTVLSV